MDLEQKKEARYKLLLSLYKKSDGNEHHIEPAFDIGDEYGWTKNETYNLVQYLESEGLLIERTVDVGICITHNGVKEIEKARANPHLQTQYFPPIANIIIIGQAINSPIQQSSPQSTQTVRDTFTNLDSINDLTKYLSDKIDDFGLNEDQKANLVANLNTINAQLGSSIPKKSIFSDSLKTIKDIIENVATNAMSITAVKKIVEFLSQL